MRRHHQQQVARGILTIAGLVAFLLIPTIMGSIAQAQICGDADGSGAMTITDGVQVLRKAAGLESNCAERVCDVDGNGTTSVSDGVTILRRVAQLPSAMSCGTRFGELVKTITVGAITADLRIGTPPLPGPGAPQNVFAIDGPGKVQSGQVALFNVQLSRSVDSLIIAIQENGAVVEGFAELAVAASASTVDLVVDAVDVPGDASLDLSVGTRTGDQVGGFRSKPITIVPSSSATSWALTTFPAELNGRWYADLDGSWQWDIAGSNNIRTYNRFFSVQSTYERQVNDHEYKITTTEGGRWHTFFFRAITASHMHATFPNAPSPPSGFETENEAVSVEPVYNEFYSGNHR